MGATAETARGRSAELFFPRSQMAVPERATSAAVALAGERWGNRPIPLTQARFLSILPLASRNGVDPRQQWSLFPL